MSNVNNTEFSVDITTLLRILRKYLVVIIVFTVLASIFALILSELILDKKYSANAKFYIENRQTQGDIINVGDITASRNMVNTCAELFSTRDIAKRLKDAANSPYTETELLSMINMGTTSNTEFLRITITASDPWTAVYLLDHFVELCIIEFDTVIETGRISIVESPYSSGKPVFPNTKLFLAAGFMLGFVLTYLTVFIIEILNTKVKAEDDLFRIYDIPVFAEVLSFDAKLKGEYGYE